VRILYSIPNFYTCGSQQVLLNLLEKIRGNDRLIDVVCEKIGGKNYDIIKNSGVKIHIRKLTESRDNVFKFFLHIFSYALFIRRNNYDLILSFHYSADYSEALASKLANCRYIIFKKNMSWHGPSYNSWRLRCYLSDRIIAQNNTMMDEFFKGNPKVSHIPIGVNRNIFFSRPKDFDINFNKMEFGLDSKKTIITCIANPIPVKGIEELLDAILSMNIINNTFLNNSVFVFAGNYDTDFGHFLKGKVINKVFFEDKIKFLGYKNNVRSLLWISDVFIQVSRLPGEGSPIAMQEAMACGIPCLGTNVPGIRDQLSNNEENLINVNRIEEIFPKIERLRNDFNYREQTVKNQFIKINEIYDLKIECESHIKLYNDLIYGGGK
jgi:glycosyltransferase involved in cell wall biosynthesis